MLKEVNYNKCQVIQNVRMHMGKTKVYAHWSRVNVTVLITYILDWNRIGGV